MATSLPIQLTNHPTTSTNNHNIHQHHPSSFSQHQNTSNTPTNSNSTIPFKFVHNFKYNYNSSCNQIKHIPELANEYEKAIQITPVQFDLKDSGNTLVVTLLTTKEKVHDAKNLNTLAILGITLKLNPTQSNKNSIFCINGPHLSLMNTKHTSSMKLTSTT